MPEVSVIIPARKEEYLAKTVESIHRAIRRDTDILVVIDAEEAGPPVPELPGVRVIRNETPLGQRASVNLAARLSTARFILKTDGHSLLADGFDVTLPADCTYADIVLPRMYNLHAHDLICRKCGTRFYNRGAHRPCPKCHVCDYKTELVFQPNWRKMTDWMWFRSPTCKDRPLRVQYWGMKSLVCHACGGGHDGTPDNGCCDYCGKPGPFRKTREFPAENKTFRRWAQQQGEIADVMTGQGACFFLHRERFLELGGLDEAHGSWGQVGVEVACKAWLSGGRHLVNRKTWFAHLFRCGDGQSFPYQIHASDQQKARDYSIDLWSHNKWPQQVRPLEWLVEKFWPVPTWEQPDAETIQAFLAAKLLGATTNVDERIPIVVPAYKWFGDDTTSNHADALRLATIEQLAAIRAAELSAGTNLPDCGPLNDGPIAARPHNATPEVAMPIDPGEVVLPNVTVLYYTDGSLPDAFRYAVFDQLRSAVGDAPIVTQIQPPEWPRNHESIYRNVLAGLEKVTTPYVALAEHDVLYPPGYFRHRVKADFDYNVNRWCLHADQLVYSRRREWALSQLFARTDLLRENLQWRLTLLRERPADCLANFEPGKNDWGLGLPPVTIHRFKAKLPTVDITGHGYNLTGAKAPKEKVCDEVPYWGAAAPILAKFAVPQPDQPQSAGLDLVDAAVAHIDLCMTMGQELLHPGPTVHDSANPPKVSILIPARNEPYLEATVRDLLKNLRLDFEILIGLDGPDQTVGLFGDERVRVHRTEQRVGMRPLINMLARKATGEYLIRLDAHCMIAEGMDQALVEVCEREGHVGVVAMRYELDAKRWQRRDQTDVPYRRLSHKSEDGVGLRSLPWPQWADAHQAEVIGETMSCSGSSWTCRRSTFVDWWGGFDEQHGTFGQEGCEIACMFWLSGGRFLVHKGTWYAHHNRGKATYALGGSVKPRSIEHSHHLWVGNHWKFARYGFDWLIAKFQPPGWPKPKPLAPDVARAVAPKSQRAWMKTRKRLLVKDLWAARDEIADPGKQYRLQIFWKSYEEFVKSVLAGKPEMEGQYRHYLLSHVTRDPGHRPTPAEIRKVEKSLQDSIRLIASVQTEGLKAPLEFYQQDGRMILWKGYRRLVIARAVGIPNVVGRCYADRKAAGVLSPQVKLTKLQPPAVDDLHRLAEEQFRQWGHGATDKYFTHGYTRYYDVHLHPIRKRVKQVLELGLLNGASLALWRQYFPKAALYGVDIDPARWKKFAGTLKNCQVLIGDETSQEFMASVAHRGPFDLIVDDASHDPLLQRQAFEWLWPAVRQYGYYVIEDVFRGYDGGESQKPPGLPLGFEQHIYSQRDVLAVHHYYNIVFVQKA